MRTTPATCRQRRRPTRRMQQSVSFGRRPWRATSLLSPQLIRETFGGRRASRLVPVGFFGRPHARKRRVPRTLPVILSDLVLHSPYAASARESLRPIPLPELLARGDLRLLRFLAGRRCASRERHPAFGWRRRTSNCRLPSASVRRPSAALPLALAAELQDVGLTGLRATAR